MRHLGTQVAVAVAVATGCSAPFASACDNTSESRPMERRLPDVSSVISGAYVRHSPEWFEWRVKDRSQKLAEASGDGAPASVRLAILDDLGVAYDKLGRHADAIKVGRAAYALEPTRYATLANLGTYLAHAGQAAEGVDLLRRAVEANPDAHFGRGTTEIAVFEYVELRRHGGEIELPLFDPQAQGDRAIGLSAFLAARRTPAGTTVMPLSADERAAAVQGVVGMMFSTRNDDPVLLEALAHVLVDPNQAARAPESARRFAARAYVSAATHVASPDVALAYRRLAADVLDAPDPVTGVGTAVPGSRLADLEASMRWDRTAADDVTEELRADEKQWLASAADPEAEFVKKYLEPSTADLTRGGFARRGEMYLNAGPVPAPGAVTSLTPTNRHPERWTGLLAAAVGLFAGAGLLGWATSGGGRHPPRRRVRGRLRTARAR